jgi:hypothetical protein
MVYNPPDKADQEMHVRANLTESNPDFSFETEGSELLSICNSSFHSFLVMERDKVPPVRVSEHLGSERISLENFPGPYSFLAVRSKHG